MLRRLPSAVPCALALVAVSLAGCGTIYDDMYSPRRSRFTPPAEKREPTTLPDSGPIPAGDTTPIQPDSSTGGAELPPPPPMDAGAAPLPGMDAAVPGMDAAAPPEAPADPAATPMTPEVPGL
jgi:hypothetical protein